MRLQDLLESLVAGVGKIGLETGLVFESNEEGMGEIVVQRLDVFRKSPFDGLDRVDLFLQQHEFVHDALDVFIRGRLLELKCDKVPEYRTVLIIGVKIASETCKQSQ